MNKNHKHVISLVTRICRNCGLSADQKLTTHCCRKQLKASSIKLITEGKLDFNNDIWIDLRDKANKPIQALAKEMANVFGKAFKQRETKTEPPNFTDGELELLQRIKSNPIPVSFILDMKLAIADMFRLRTLCKHGAVTIHDGAYWITQYGNDFLIEPEVFITDTELAFMLCCQRDGYLLTEINESEEAWNAYQSLYSKRLVTPVIKCVELTQAGHDHIAKLCAIPL